MGKKLVLISFGLFVLAFGSAPRSNAGTEVIEPYRAPAPTYNYAPPPPRPIVYAPPPVVGVVVAPAFGFYGRRYGYYGRRYGFYGAHRFYGRHGYWRDGYHRWR